MKRMKKQEIEFPQSFPYFRYVAHKQGYEQRFSVRFRMFQGFITVGEDDFVANTFNTPIYIFYNVASKFLVGYLTLDSQV